MVIFLVHTSAQKNIVLNSEILEPSQLKLKTRMLTLYAILNIVLEIFANPIRKQKAITDIRIS